MRQNGGLIFNMTRLNTVGWDRGVGGVEDRLMDAKQTFLPSSFYFKFLFSMNREIGFAPKIEFNEIFLLYFVSFQPSRPTKFKICSRRHGKPIYEIFFSEYTSCPESSLKKYFNVDLILLKYMHLEKQKITQVDVKENTNNDIKRKKEVTSVCQGKDIYY